MSIIFWSFGLINDQFGPVHFHNFLEIQTIIFFFYITFHNKNIIILQSRYAISVFLKSLLLNFPSLSQLHNFLNFRRADLSIRCMASCSPMLYCDVTQMHLSLLINRSLINFRIKGLISWNFIGRNLLRSSLVCMILILTILSHEAKSCP